MVMVMAIRITLGEVVAECDSASEAAELVQALRGIAAPVTREIAGRRAGSRDFAAFWSCLDEPSQGFLRRVSEADGHLEASKLAEFLDADLNGVGWIRRKMKPLARKHGFILDKLIVTDKVTVGDKPKTAYLATDNLKRELKSLQAAS